MNRVASILLPVVVFALVVGGVAFSVFAAGERPTGPVDVVWDKTACAACSMHVGEPAFAAQIVTSDGKVYVFDDPGCLFHFESELEGVEYRVWFHHLREDRWLPAEAVGFVEIMPTPMGFGLGAVDPGTPGSLDLEEARRRCLDRGTRPEKRK